MPVRLLLLVAVVLTGCRGGAGKCMPNERPASDAEVVSEKAILLFDGTGSSPCDVVAIEEVLDANRLSYFTANTAELNGMSGDQLRRFRLLIVPGGDFIEMGSGLSSRAIGNVGAAVKNGLNYLGICAGGFLAGSSARYNCFHLTDSVPFGFYSAEKLNIRKAAVAIAFPDAPVADHYWEDGPEFTGWGSVVAKYPDGTPAIVQGAYGKGGVLLMGVHPEAPQNWRRNMSFHTSAAADNRYAATLIQAALNRILLPHY